MTLTRKYFRHACAVAAAGLALSVAAPATAAVAATPGSAVPDRLYGVSAVSASDIWAVGITPYSALIMHWDGSAWTSTTPPTGFLRGVTATSPGNAWAVGGTNWGTPDSTLVYHWDGSNWTIQPTPNPPGGGYFNGVAATSASDAWAVGQTGGGPGVGTGPSDRTLAEHWDGTSWTTVPSPTPAPAGALNQVTAVSPSNAWAVGWTGTGTGNDFSALIEHWDGKSWNTVPVPASAGAHVELNGVTGTSASNLWAVGLNLASGDHRPVILHWNGATWRRAANPAHAPYGNLLGVTASSASNAWAVGQTTDSSGGCSAQCKTIIEHWNGCMWTMVRSPNPPSGYLNALFSAAIIAKDNAWAVGTTDYDTTLIVHWNGTSWS